MLRLANRQLIKTSETVNGQQDNFKDKGARGGKFMTN